ncbi:anhydro-N-acetylmuramic acid kinase [Epilithonimonas arachidiradicis]|uniref:Anhydro-N-acetylmuramic acid kinase n=1 Tax=Epilithonimonas arachidiradicis TaxID=1617282 RepID=A0A420DCJ4_9FLAO|nr:anhydro-N-acetylmuramic acid kinase [Epilithonimonas arachidiradicis]RKE88967.1 anhydro-N-acetylmuramic acid kinase [Epilithonimonas arachidiradicis]GGG53622.1 anhydro-N-acetylmuramic acid kinase [Epilithonimonas arachidiradicis]
MGQQTFFAIGLMSGTSLDGLDICYAKFTRKESTWNFEILKCNTLPYSSELENILRNAIYLSSEELLKLNSEYGFYLGDQVSEFISKHHISELDLIASHGHTVFHQPQKLFTLQIGDGRAIKSKINKTVIYDFRSQDVILGGNAAPLVPIGDELLFSEFDACLNLGGFSNISLNRDGERIAFDICPVNILLNDFALQLGKKYDENGDLAKAGMVDERLLDELNQLSFYSEKHPKSLGVEWINNNIQPLIQNQKVEDLLATFTEHSAFQIAKILDEYEIQNVLITGGGAYNSYLIEKIKAKTKTEIHIPEKEIIEYKEALIFAFMGVLRSLGLNNILSSATGSSGDHSSGLIC